MATVVVSGSVDERVKARADAFIRAAGLSSGDVIRMVWERIAQTGEVPDAPHSGEKTVAADDPLARLGELRAAFGASEELVNLTDSQTREMRADRYAR